MKHDLLATLNLPRRNVFFTDRQEILSKVHAAFRADTAQKTLRILALCGLGGIGKTQIAIEYAHCHFSDYLAILWVNASSQDTYHTDILTIAELLSLPEKNEQDEGTIINAVKQWLAEHSHWLLILDNIEDETQLSDFLPSTGKGHVLLTTQIQSIDRVAERIQVDEMNVREGALFLLQRTKLLAEDDVDKVTSTDDFFLAKKIADLMGCLPLALDQAGAFIEETNCNLRDYLNLYETERAALLKQRGGIYTDLSYQMLINPEFTHPNSVVTTWSLSIEKAARDHPLAADVLFMCAFLHPDTITEELIANVSDFTTVHPSAKVTPELLEDAVDVLCKYSLLQRDPDHHQLSIHRLVQAVLQDKLDREAQRKWAEYVVRLVARVFPPVDFEHWERCRLYLPQAQHCKQLIEQWHIESPEAAKLLHVMGFYLFERARYDSVADLYRRALEMQERFLGSKHPDVATILHHEAMLCRERGDYDNSEKLFKKSLRIRMRALGLQHLETADTLHQLGQVYRIQALYITAERLLKQAKKIREQLLPMEDPIIAFSLYELGCLYKRLGRYESAEPLLKQAYDIQEKILEPGHPQTTQTLIDLAWLYYETGLYSKAEQLLLQAKNIQERSLAINHPRLAQIFNALGMLYCVQERYEEAEPLHLQALKIRRNMPEHSDYAQSLDNLALLYYHQGRYREAEPLYHEALKIREKVFREGHPDTTRTLTNLARLYREEGKYDEAEQLFQQALRIRIETLGYEHPHVANCLYDLGKLYELKHNYAQAEEYYLQALRIREAKLEPTHPRLAQLLIDLAVLNARLQNYQQAELFLSKIRPSHESELAFDVGPLIRSLKDYAALLRDKGETSRAAYIDTYIRALSQKHENEENGSI